MPINFHIKTKDVDLTPALTAIIHEKLGVVEQYINPQADETVLAEVEVGLRSKHHKKGDVYRAEINLTHKGELYRATARAGDINSAIDAVRDDITRQVRRSKNKKIDIFRKGGRAIKSLLRSK